MQDISIISSQHALRLWWNSARLLTHDVALKLSCLLAVCARNVKPAWSKKTNGGSSPRFARASHVWHLTWKKRSTMPGTATGHRHSRLEINSLCELKHNLVTASPFLQAWTSRGTFYQNTSEKRWSDWRVILCVSALWSSMTLQSGSWTTNIFESCRVENMATAFSGLQSVRILFMDVENKWCIMKCCLSIWLTEMFGYSVFLISTQSL
jgi:hypothetical protein